MPKSSKKQYSDHNLLTSSRNSFEKYGAVIGRIPECEYQKFEKQWKRLNPRSREAQNIERKLYELIEMDRRRALGQFYTPSKIAQIAWSMIVKQLGDHFWQDGTWRIWDNCTGSGNLEYEIIHQEALQYTYLSTINTDEVEFLKENNYFKGKCRGIFQFDWLNDTEKRLPEQLKKDLQNSNLKWLFFINPPYADSGTGIGKEYKYGVKFGNIADEMKKAGMGQCANELTLQFLYRIERDFAKRGYYLALFSTPKWITKSSVEGFRKIWYPVFHGGFMLNAGEHFIQQRTKNKLELKAHGHFPILFSLLDRLTKSKTTWETQDWTYYEIDKFVNKIHTKTFSVFNAKRLTFRDYFFPLDTAQKNRKRPIMASALIRTDGSSRILGDVSSDFIGSIKLATIDFHGQNMCFLQSSLPTSHEVCITKQNYPSVLTGFALYKSVEYEWTKHEDIFYAPYRNLTRKEMVDCLLYALLDSKNNTATTTVEIKDEKFFLKNWFNPFDETKFDWNGLSKVGREAFAELTNYCDNIVQWRILKTVYGNNKGQGVWMGLYQYRTSYDDVNKTYKKKFGVDYPNRDLYDFAYPPSFKEAIEKLRQRIEVLAIDLCLTAGKEVTRTRDTFLEQIQKQLKLS